MKENLLRVPGIALVLSQIVLFIYIFNKADHPIHAGGSLGTWTVSWLALIGSYVGYIIILLLGIATAAKYAPENLSQAKWLLLILAFSCIFISVLQYAIAVMVMGCAGEVVVLFVVRGCGASMFMEKRKKEADIPVRHIVV